MKNMVRILLAIYFNVRNHYMYDLEQPLTVYLSLESIKSSIKRGIRAIIETVSLN